MAEGKLNIFALDDTSGNKPHFRGYVEIGGEVHELALWPAKSGKGFSGKYKPKEDRGGERKQQAPVAKPLSDDIQF